MILFNLINQLISQSIDESESIGMVIFSTTTSHLNSTIFTSSNTAVVVADSDDNDDAISVVCFCFDCATTFGWKALT